jgi:hypothetical protein
VDADGKVMSVITYYTDDDHAECKDIHLDFQKDGQYEIHLVDKDHEGTLVQTTKDLTFSMTPNACLLIKEI